MDPLAAATGPATAATGAARPPAREDAAMLQAAEEFEAAFLAEMLKSAGLDKPPGALGGGEGEEQFGSFLVREQARAMARAGGIGLAETIYQAMRKRADG